jgi:hypothetical protein
MVVKGHRIPEEHPEFVLTLVNDFFGRNTTKGYQVMHI